MSILSSHPLEGGGGGGGGKKEGGYKGHTLSTVHDHSPNNRCTHGHVQYSLCGYLAIGMLCELPVTVEELVAV